MSSSPLLGAQCSAQSIGTVNTMVSTLLQALLAAQCAISPPDLWPADYAEQALQKGLGTYDYVVVGAGSAGSVVASRLSENPSLRVLVLEAGGDPPQESEIPATYFTLGPTDASWKYLTEYSDKACWASVDRRCFWPRGKMIGGSGGTNVMYYVRGNSRDYDEWAEAGNTGWGWNDVLPYFERSLLSVGNHIDPKGYLAVNDFPPGDPNTANMIFSGAEELGVPHVNQFAEGSYIGYTHIQATYENGRRMSPGKTFLAQVAQRSNLKVIKNAVATKLNFDKTGEKVRSVSFVLQGQHELEVGIGKELVLSAGAIETPKLLLLSGVGPAEHLEQLNIPVVQDLPVGNNLQDHLLMLSFMKVNENVAKPLTATDSLDNTYNYLIHGNGGLGTTGTGAIIGFINTLNNGPYPDIEFHHVGLTRNDFATLQILVDGFKINADAAAELRTALETADILVAGTTLLNPKSSGHIRLRSADVNDPPILTHNYLSDPEDVEAVLRGVRFQEQLLETTAFKAMNATRLLPKLEDCDVFVPRSDDYWRCYSKHFSFTIFHPTSTVKMAPVTDATGCVDPRLRLRGIPNVRVVDASVIPKVTSGNTNAPTIMVAEKVVDLIREDHQKDSI